MCKISEVPMMHNQRVEYPWKKSRLFNVSVNSINIYVQGVRVNNTGKNLGGQLEMISKINGKSLPMIIQGAQNLSNNVGFW